MTFSKNEQTSKEPVSGKGPSPVQHKNIPALQPVPTNPPNIQEIVNRLEDLVKFALECEGKQLREGISFVEVFKQLEQVRHSIDLLSQDQKELLSVFAAVSGRTVDLNQIELSEDNKKIITKLQELQSMCDNAKERIHRTIQSAPESESIVQQKIEEMSSSEHKKIARRKRKFRPLGEKEGWMRT